jgi:hypothetical protein
MFLTLFLIVCRTCYSFCACYFCQTCFLICFALVIVVVAYVFVFELVFCGYARITAQSKQFRTFCKAVKNFEVKRRRIGATYFISASEFEMRGACFLIFCRVLRRTRNECSVHPPAIVRVDLNHTNVDGTRDTKGAIASSRSGSLHLSMDQAWIRMAPGWP